MGKLTRRQHWMALFLEDHPLLHKGPLRPPLHLECTSAPAHFWAFLVYLASHVRPFSRWTHLPSQMVQRPGPWTCSLLLCCFWLLSVSALHDFGDDMVVRCKKKQSAAPVETPSSLRAHGPANTKRTLGLRVYREKVRPRTTFSPKRVSKGVPLSCRWVSFFSFVWPVPHGLRRPLQAPFGTYN